MSSLKYEAVLFDMDGTILDTADDLADAVNKTLSVYGFPEVSRKQVIAATGNGAAHLLAECLPEGRETSGFDEILSIYREYYAAHACVKTVPYKNIPELLRELREAGVKVAIISNKPHEAVRSLAERFFPNIPSYGEVADIPRKPAPDMVLRVLDGLGVDKAHAVYVGDSEVDIQTARNAGLDLAAVCWGFRSKAQLARAGAKYIAVNCGELRKIIR